MSRKIIFIFLSIIISTYQIHLNPIDDSTEENDILRAKFLQDKRKNNITATQLKFLEKYATNDSVLVEDILHYNTKGHRQLKQVKKIETEFRNMIAMDGVTYIYNRDMAWRTWRKVLFDKKAKLVHYKHETSVNCTKNCDNGGYWIIEKNPPPCALEIFSIDKNAACAIAMKYYHSKKVKCSSYLFSQLTSTCDNPMVTRWIVQKSFSQKGKKQRFPVVICGRREFCRILTVYKISPDHVSFKIINSTNHIVYSRIMKPNHENYACVTNCGIFDEKTNTVIKPEKPWKLNLLNKLNKKINKREKNYHENHESNNKINKLNTKIKKTEKIFHKNNNKGNGDKNTDNISSRFKNSKVTTHPPSCSNLRHDNGDDDIDDEEVDNDSSKKAILLWDL